MIHESSYKCEAALCNFPMHYYDNLYNPSWPRALPVLPWALPVFTHNFWLVAVMKIMSICWANYDKDYNMLNIVTETMFSLIYPLQLV